MEPFNPQCRATPGISHHDNEDIDQSTPSGREPTSADELMEAIEELANKIYPNRTTHLNMRAPHSSKHGLRGAIQKKRLFTPSECHRRRQLFERGLAQLLAPSRQDEVPALVSDFKSMQIDNSTKS